MKIFIATGIYPPDIGGPATYSEKLANELTKRGNEVTIISYGCKIKNFTLSVVEGQKSKIKNTNQKLKIIKILRRWPLPIRYGLFVLAVFRYGLQTDTIYAQDLVSAGLPAILANLILRKPFVLKVVGDYAWERSQFQISDFKLQNLDEFLKSKPRGKIRVLWEIERWVARRADKIIVPSNYLKTVVEKWGINSKKIEVIYNSFDLSNYETELRRTPQGAQATEGRKFGFEQTLISVGRLVPWKGFDTLIDVMADLVKERQSVELVIYGDGPERDNLESRIKNLGLEKNVKLLGRIEHNKLFEELQGERKFFVLNSSYEGMSHQILECQALKIPCAVSNAGGNPEIVEDGKTGLLFEYNNKEEMRHAILRLLNDEQLVRDIKERAYKQIIERHDFKKMIEKTIHILLELSSNN